MQTAVGLGHGGDGLGPQVLGVGAGEPDPADALDRADRPQQVGEQGTAPGQVPSVGVHVLAEQGDLGDPPAGQVGHLGHQLVEGPADLAAAHRGHDAEGTRVVTAGLDGHPGRVGQVPDGDRGRPGCRAGGPGRGGSSRISITGPARRGLAQQGRGPGQVVGAEHHVDVAGPLADPLAVLLGQAAADGDLQVRAGAPAGP